MSWQHPTGTFTPSPWQQPQEPPQAYVPDFADSDDLKKAFAIELAQGVNPFEAALTILDNDTPKALWASINWTSDIAVMGYRDAYLKTLKSVEKPLDKSEILSKIRAFAEDKDYHGRYLVDAEERLKAWKLYSEVAGFIGNKIDINATNNYTENNVTKIVLVKPEPHIKTIEASNLNSKSEMTNEGVALPKLKLVGGSSS